MMLRLTQRKMRIIIYKKTLNKSFCGGSRGTYSAVLRNTLGDDTSFEASYAVLALQMLPHAVGFSRKEPPGRRRHIFLRR
jgi:hypothetical protein